MSHLIRFRSLFAAASLLTASAACNKESETRKSSDHAAEVVNDKVEDLKDESRDLAKTAKDNSDNINAIDEVRTPGRIADNGTADIVDRSAVGDRDLPGNSAPTSGQVMDRRVDRKDSVADVSKYVHDKADVEGKKLADGVQDIAGDAKDVGTKAHELENANNEFKYRRTVRVGTLRAVHSVAASQPGIINAFTQSYPLVEKDRGEVNEKLQIFQMRLDEAGNAIQSLELVEANDWEARNDAASKALERVEDSRDDAWEALRGADLTGDKTSMR
jgi:hypothetical protein